MTKRELIILLLEDRQGCDSEVMVLDGFNGGGVPRTINIGPKRHTITSEDTEKTVDCECREGESVVLIGFGSY
jgi:hypothetical protein